MVTKVRYDLVDDLDGSEAATTVTFGWGGIMFEVDLNEAHAAEMQEQFQRYLNVARRARSQTVKLPSKPRGTRKGETLTTRLGHRTSDVRAWAKQQDLGIPDRGRVADWAVQAYHDAMNPPEPPPAKKVPAKKVARKRTQPAAAAS